MKHEEPLQDDDLQIDRAVRRAFAGASDLAPRDDDGARIDAAIARALVANEKRRASPASRSRWAVYLVAAALCVGALAYAAVHRQGESAPAAPTAVEATTDTPVVVGSGVPAAAPSEPPPVTAPEPVTPDSLPSVSPPPRASTSVVAAPTPAKPAIAAGGARPSEPGTDALGPAELFARANEARRANETDRAIALHEELQSKFPDSREASTSRVALGRLLLDRAGDPGRARALFERYLERDPSGPLAEEARVGRALAAMRLGDRGGERGAWLEVLERHPGSVHAQRARQRLSELGN